MNSYDILIVGGGQSARKAALTARSVQSNLSIAILGEEPHLPYDRPPLSKAALKGADITEACEIVGAGQYEREGIKLFTHTRVQRLDLANHVVSTEDGRRFQFVRLILATGSRIRRLPLPDDLAEDVFYLRTRDDAERLRSRLGSHPRILIIGAGFIGLEVAATAREIGCQVTVVDQADRVLARVFPRLASQTVEAIHRSAGVEFHLGSRIRRISRGAEGMIQVETTSQHSDGGTVIQANMLVVGIGVVPNVELAQDAGLRVEDGIVVDAWGRTSAPNIFAAGEVTQHPVMGYEGGCLRLESWQVAELQSEAVGATAAGSPRPYESLPWFWSDQFGTNVQMLGYIPAAPQWVRRGPTEGAHTLFALDARRRIAAAIAFNSGRDIAATRRLMAQGHPVDPNSLADENHSWRELMSAQAR